MMERSFTEFLRAPAAPGSAPGSAVDAILDAVRRHLNMDIAFASRIGDGRREFTHIRCDFALPLGPGDSEPLEDTFCQRIIDGRLPALIHDASDFPAATELALTRALPIGSHLNVPLRLSDGTLYGTFCCLTRVPDRTLNARDMDTLRAFADLAAREIETGLRSEREESEARARITTAIEGGQPAMHFQPIHRLGDAGIVGVEALARFADHRTRPPSDWFNEAAGVGLGPMLELVAARRAIAAIPYIPPPCYVAVNLCPAALCDPALDAIVAAAPPGRLVLEITEQTQIDSYGEMHARLAQLRPYARIAIDDLGAGYANLRHIIELQPDLVKLDMSLVRHVDTDPARAALVAALVGFAAQTGCAVVAEGVETAAERATLRDLGIDYGQGWHFSRAMPVVAVQQLLLGRREETQPGAACVTLATPSRAFAKAAAGL